MKKSLLLFFLFFPVFVVFAQPITVNTTAYTVPQLVQNVLFASGTVNPSCVGTITNITWSTGTNYGSFNGIGYFENTNPTFPLTSGVILSTGLATNAPGPNDVILGDGVNGWLGDAQLFNYIQGLGIDPGLTSYNNASILEFDFTPLTNTMSFDFLFASEEYGTFQCTFSDSFAFFLTNVTAGTPPINLALIPNTTTPISVVTIRDDANNGGCASANPTYFGNYNEGATAPTSATNFNGETVLMTASSTVIPNNVYHIKLVIADRNDSSYDSAVFLGGGSFDIGSANIVGTGEFDGLGDFTIANGNAQCGGKIINIQAGTTPIPGATYSWTFNGGAPIVGATSSSIDVDEAGVYEVTITYAGGCQQTDDIVVEYIPSLPLGDPIDLVECYALFDLTQNTPIIQNALIGYPVNYYHSLFDAENSAFVIPNPTVYPGFNGEVIYSGVEDPDTGCINTASFSLFIDPSTCLFQPIQPSDLVVCDDVSNDGIAIFNFTPQTAVVLGTNPSADYTVTYHLSQLEADGDSNAINPISSFTNTTNPQTIYVRMEKNVDPSIYGTTTFQLIVNPLPVATISGNTTICSGTTAVITFTGTPVATVDYTVDGVAGQIVLNGSGTFTVTTPVLTTTSVYSLVSVTNTTTTCFQTQSGTATVTVNSLPTATISGTTAVCQNGTNPLVTFTGANGTAPYTFTYTINNGSNQTITTTAGNNATVSAPTTATGTFIYELVSVSSGSTAVCSQVQIDSATITVNPLPTATISGTLAVCQNNTNPLITFTGANGTTPYTFTYTINGGATQTVTTTVGNSATVSAPTTATGTFIYELVSVSSASTPACSQTQTSTATVTVNSLPTATISGTTAVCQNGTNPLVTFTGANGTAPYTFTYTINNGSNQTITTTAGNNATVSAPTTATGTFIYELVSVSSGSTAVCSQAQIDSATITVNPLPTATISGTLAVCQNNTNPLITFTGANGTTPYTFTYTINGGATQTVTTTVGNSATVSAPTTATGIFDYELVSVSSASTPACSQVQTEIATITVNVAPTINNPAPYEVCDDNNDGVSCLFDLTTINNQITGGNPNLVVTYHETLTDSQTGANPQTSPYCSIDNTGLQTLYIKVYNVGSPACYSNTTLQLIVNPRPIPNLVIMDYELCDVNNAGDESEIFNLPTKDLEIANGQTGVAVSYYATQAEATSQTNPLPNLYANTSNPQEIWINISYVATGCNSISSFNLVVNPLPTVVAPNPMFECSNGLTDQAEFDLTLNDSTISNGELGVTVTYYETLLDAQTETSPLAIPYTNTTNPQIVFVRVENDATGCFDTTTLTLQVTQGPVAVIPTALEYCDPNNDGFGVFDLESATNQIAGGSLPAGVTVTYHETQTDAETGANLLLSPYENINPWTQTIYVRVFYTLTGCSNFVTLQLIVNPTPEATEPLDYHLCDDNYDGFASFDLTTITSEVLGSIDPLTHLVTYYTDLAGAELGTNPITNVTNYTNVIIDTQPLWVRVETIATGCIDIVELQLVVDPLPQATQPNYPQYSLCETALSPIGYEQFDLGSQIDAISLGQTGMNITFHLSQAEADLDSNALPLLYTNQAQYVQTLWIRIENDATGCYVLSTMDIRVEPLPSPIPPTEPYSICDDNQDGLSEFDLTTLTAAILQGGNYTITYHETAIDASLGENALVSPYQNIYPFIQILYVAAVDTLTACRSVIAIELNVSPSPVMPTTLPNLTNCDQDSNNQSASTSFDLTQQTALILAAQQTAAINYTVTYYTSQLNAENGIAPIIPATNYPGSNGQTIWVRVTHNTTDCYNIGSFQLLVNIPLLLTTPLPLSICDNDSNPNDLYTTFDLTVKDDDIIGLPGYTVTYYSTYPVTASSVAIANPTAYINTSPAVQTLGVMVTSPEGCKSYITLDIRVLPVPVPQTNPPALAPQCDDNIPGDMLETFDLTTNAAYIINNDPNITLHYFESQADAIANVNEILLPATALVGGLIIADQSVWIRVENNREDYLGNNCYVLVEQLLTVNPLPSVATIADYQICEDDLATNDGFEVFDLTSQAAALLASNPTTSTYTLTYHTATPPTAANQISTPSAYTNTSNPQTIYVVAINDGTGCISQVGQFTILVNPRPEFTQPTTLLTTCDSDGTNDGEFAYPLDTTITTEILNGQDPTLFAVTFYDSEFNPDATPPLLPTAISDLANYQGYTHTIWAAVTNIATGCQKIGSFEAIVEQLPEPEITTVNNINTICVDFINNVVIRELTLTAINNTVYLDPTTIPTPSFEYHWFEDGVEVGVSTTNTYTITQPLNDTTSSMFTVEMVNMTTLGCSQSATNFEVIQSGPASIPVGTAGYTVTNAFAQNQTITVEIEGYGTYQYSLDQGPRQDSTVFENVALGEHTITIWDTEGGLEYSCDSVILYDVQIIDYPHYFTPNGDGIHDTWNIFGLSGQPNAKIYIFDRYGKLLKQISSTGQGWDGTFNGKLLPSTDYWFTVDFMETSKAKQFKAHFSLKR